MPVALINKPFNVRGPLRSKPGVSRLSSIPVLYVFIIVRTIVRTESWGPAPAGSSCLYLFSRSAAEWECVLGCVNCQLRRSNCSRFEL
jgi:hypothetical protein